MRQSKHLGPPNGEFFQPLTEAAAVICSNLPRFCNLAYLEGPRGGGRGREILEMQNPRTGQYRSPWATFPLPDLVELVIAVAELVRDGGGLNLKHYLRTLQEEREAEEALRRLADEAGPPAADYGGVLRYLLSLQEEVIVQTARSVHAGQDIDVAAAEALLSVAEGEEVLNALSDGAYARQQARARVLRETGVPYQP